MWYWQWWKKGNLFGTAGGPDGGYLVGLDYYGNELFNIDSNITTYSWYAKLCKPALAIPEIGDLFKVGKSQIQEVYKFDIDDITANKKIEKGKVVKKPVTKKLKKSKLAKPSKTKLPKKLKRNLKGKKVKATLAPKPATTPAASE